MTREERDFQKDWYCADRECGNVLGNVVSGALVLKLDSVLTANTQGVALVVTCSKCGTPKLWYPSFEDCAYGTATSLRRLLGK